jgi:hypothetical protein
MNPQIVYPQNPLNSKTILVNVFGSVLVWLVAKYGLGAVFTPDVVNQVATGSAMAVMAVANVVLRKYTNGALSFDAPLVQPPAQTLVTGTVAVTTPHPSVGGPVVVTALPTGNHTINVPAPAMPTPPPAAVSFVPPPMPAPAPPLNPVV